MSKMHLYYTGEDSGVPTISFDKDNEAIVTTIEKFDKIVERIESKDFNLSKRPEGKLCGDCDIRHHCNFKNWE